MSMVVNYLVHSVSLQPKTREVVLEGEKVSVPVDHWVFELVDEDGQHGTSTLRFWKHDEVEAAKLKFVKGTVVPVTY